jgi:hypothetical protein
MGINASYFFDLDVFDKPRLFKDKILYEVEIGKMKTFKLPVIEEFGPLTVIHQNMPSFASYSYLEYKIYPNNK